MKNNYCSFFPIIVHLASAAIQDDIRHFCYKNRQAELCHHDKKKKQNKTVVIIVKIKG